MADSSLISRLSDWSSISSPLAPLTPNQLDMVSELGEVVKTRPRPPHLPPTQVTHPGDRMSSTASVVSSLSDTKEQANISTNQLFPAFSQLECGGQSIDTGQQFLQWLHQVETSLVAEQSLPYQKFIKDVSRLFQVCSKGVEGYFMDV